jgi:hypothetical protein
MAPANIRTKARLWRPAEPKGARWTFLVLPAPASAKLPARGLCSVQGTINGAVFRATLEPDGKGSHWLKVGRALREKAGASVGDTVDLAFAPVAREPEPRLPADLRQALAGQPAACAVWKDITPVARRDWIQWIVSARRAETRARRIANACDMLATGKRRACCFDRSGIYGGGLGAPTPAS